MSIYLRALVPQSDRFFEPGYSVANRSYGVTAAGAWRRPCAVSTTSNCWPAATQSWRVVIRLAHRPPLEVTTIFK